MSLKLKQSLLKVSAFVFTCTFMINVHAGTVSSTLDQTTSQPDITSGDVDTTYLVDSSGNGSFVANGTPIGLTYQNNFELITGGTFEILADIQPNAGTANGTLKIGGAIASLGFGMTGDDLLVGNLAQIGGPGAALNFVFNIIGGDAAGIYGGVGSSVGVIMGATAGYNGVASFTLDFNGTSSADAFAVPTPSTIALFLMGFAALGLRRNLRA